MTVGRAELPAGTVTLVLTDIEGSTRLVRELGGPTRARSATTATSSATPSAPTAASRWTPRATPSSTRSPTRGMPCGPPRRRSAASRPPLAGGHAVRVRMGVHTGRPTRTDEGYVGMDLHEAARIMAAAHGDQVLVSRATVESVGAGAIAGLSLDDLGEHRLKDLALPARLYQLTARACATSSPRRAASRATSPTCRPRDRGSSAATPTWPRCAACSTTAGA